MPDDNATMSEPVAEPNAEQAAASPPVPVPVSLTDEVKAFIENAVAAAKGDAFDEAKRVAEDAAMAAVNTALDDLKAPASTGALGTEAIDGLKSWVRKELGLALDGHSEDTRQQANP